MAMRLAATVRQERLRVRFRRLIEERLGREREGHAPKRSGDLPSTSNLVRSSAGRALLADPFEADAGDEIALLPDPRR